MKFPKYLFITQDDCEDCGCDPCQCDELDEREEYFEQDFDCHMGRDGNCGKAGSEECDFECPYRNLKRN